MNHFFEGPRGQALKTLAETLWSHGFVVYLAGGCVRDYLLGRPYHDLDAVTDAPVEKIQSIFKKTIPVGIQFGIVRVLLDGFEFELARFRSDGPYLDGRHPEYVIFSKPEEDAKRRDFTINAMFYDLQSEQVLDFVNGQEDLKHKILRAVGEPQRRFAEDFLRILRLLRFSCQLNFKIDEATAEAAEALVGHLPEVSGERLCVEVSKSLAANPKKALEGFYHWGLSKILFPSWSALTPQFYLLRDKHESGWLLSMWLLSFEPDICSAAVQFVSDCEWQYSRDFLARAEEMGQRFKLSKMEARRLKEVSSVFAWSSIWFQLRAGFRGALAQSTAFQDVFDAAQQLGVWDEKVFKEVSYWRQEPLVKPFLLGQDVLCVAADQRGLVLKESLYLQYENILLNREQALEWLQKRK